MTARMICARRWLATLTSSSLGPDRGTLVTPLSFALFKHPKRVLRHFENALLSCDNTLTTVMALLDSRAIESSNKRPIDVTTLSIGACNEQPALRGVSLIRQEAHE